MASSEEAGVLNCRLLTHYYGPLLPISLDHHTEPCWILKLLRRLVLNFCGAKRGDSGSCWVTVAESGHTLNGSAGVKRLNGSKDWSISTKHLPWTFNYVTTSLSLSVSLSLCHPQASVYSKPTVPPYDHIPVLLTQNGSSYEIERNKNKK